MPEVVEVRITKEYCDKVASTFGSVTAISKTDSGGQPLDSITLYPSGAPFTTQCLGKELLFTFPDGGSNQMMRLHLGMSAYLIVSSVAPQYARVQFVLSTGLSLWLVDCRRFASWTVTWGTDPASYPLDFTPSRAQGDFFTPVSTLVPLIQSAASNLSSSAKTQLNSQPLCETLLNQSLFNGCGNYIRAELFNRVPSIDPFQSAEGVISDTATLTTLCTAGATVCAESLSLGGAQLRDWVNPFGVDRTNFINWLTTYGKSTMAKYKDSTGRTFWYDPHLYSPTGFPETS